MGLSVVDHAKGQTLVASWNKKAPANRTIFLLVVGGQVCHIKNMVSYRTVDYVGYYCKGCDRVVKGAKIIIFVWTGFPPVANASDSRLFRGRWFTA